MRFYAGVLASILLVGCALQPDAPAPVFPTPAGLRFAVEPQTAAPGATVTLLLINRSPHLVGYNLCGSSLERYDGASWRGVPVTGVCTRELRIASPGQTVSYTIRLPAALPAGKYRFSTGIESPLNRSTPGLDLLLSEPFTVSR